MTLQLLHSEFPHMYEGNLIFFFISVEEHPADFFGKLELISEWAQGISAYWDYMRNKT
jgi:hypothetical protein